LKSAQIEAKILKAEGVEFVTLFPDQKLADALAEEDIRVIMPRQERVAVNMADGYSRISNGRKIGVCSMQQDAGIQNAYAGNSSSLCRLITNTGSARRCLETQLQNFSKS
jgi:thiamine pyrophosphate-dependent acetolactate synthase large subunit-like protein